jgi:hypothetical protein
MLDMVFLWQMHSLVISSVTQDTLVSTLEIIRSYMQVLQKQELSTHLLQITDKFLQFVEFSNITK